MFLLLWREVVRRSSLLIIACYNYILSFLSTFVISVTLVFPHAVDAIASSAHVVAEKWGDDFPSPEDWDNEEYTGSLADSKVFTPSGGTMEPTTNSEPLVVESSNTELSSSLTVQNLSSSVASSSSQMSQSLDLHQPPGQLSQVSNCSFTVWLSVQNLSSSVASSSSQMSQSLDFHQPPGQLSQVSNCSFTVWLSVENLSSSVASSSSQMSQSLDLHKPPGQLSQVSNCSYT